MSARDATSTVHRGSIYHHGHTAFFVAGTGRTATMHLVKCLNAETGWPTDNKEMTRLEGYLWRSGSEL